MMIFLDFGCSREDGDALAPTDESTRRQKPEQQHGPHARENLRSQNRDMTKAILQLLLSLHWRLDSQ